MRHNSYPRIASFRASPIVIERAEREAKKRGQTLSEYLRSLVSRDLERAQ